MSDSTTLTRCPHCQTRFRVTEQQLGVAAGKVRCGNCMDVFDARKHKVSAEERAEAAKASAAPARGPAQTAEHDRDPSKHHWSDDATAAVETEGAPEEEAFKGPDNADEDSFEDEFIFQDDPEEDATDEGYTRASRLDDDLSDSFMALDKAGPLPDSEEEREQFEEVDESWAEAILEDNSSPESRRRREDEHPGPASPPPRSKLESAPVTPVTPAKQPEAPLKATSMGSSSTATDEMSLSLDHDEIRHRQPRTPMAANKPLTAPPRSPYANLRSTPVAARHKGRNWGSTVLWGLGCLLLLAVIVSQLFYFQFDRLSRVEPLRPFYATVCPLIGCELPVMVDTDQIESRKLVVRSHPDQPRALLVEASIVNEAPFPQPFPSIVLTFSNLNNDIVAQRAFKPKEYLAGDARELEQMPRGTPVRISLELRDPGQDAINYDLRFVPGADPE
ncbi:DUF3426 domain-containing protein [Hydrocarboniclastica marina]|uniref:DUF3426 domain-containing protein n=1 Tax=Hydrocarboniclastica marina TaxID=2259620 RepID=UPI0015621044|nr:DUF3426 domain-containing protein [Hydrocarboniclastica marina]